MMLLSTLAFIVIVISAMAILVFRDWRINTGALGIQYLAVFALVALSWPVGMSVIKLIVGWMASAAIALSCLRQNKPDTSSESSASLIFRGLVGLLMVILIFLLAPDLQANFFPRLDLVIVQSGIMLIGMALVQLGTTSSPYLTIISLLSFLAGFEVIHAGLELSTLLAGLMVIVNLALALVGVYFISMEGELAPAPEEEGAE